MQPFLILSHFGPFTALATKIFSSPSLVPQCEISYSMSCYLSFRCTITKLISAISFGLFTALATKIFSSPSLIPQYDISHCISCYRSTRGTITLSSSLLLHLQHSSVQACDHWTNSHIHTRCKIVLGCLEELAQVLHSGCLLDVHSLRHTSCAKSNRFCSTECR